MLLQLAFDGLDVVLFADESPVDHPVTVARNQPAVTRDARETGHVVDGAVLLRLHDEFVWRYRLATGPTSARQSEHPVRKHEKQVRMTVFTGVTTTKFAKQSRAANELHIRPAKHPQDFTINTLE